MGISPIFRDPNYNPNARPLSRWNKDIRKPPKRKLNQRESK